MAATRQIIINVHDWEKMMKRILAVSSSGGHWQNLMGIRDAFAGCEVEYATTDAHYAFFVPGHQFHVVRNVSRWDRLKIPLAVVQIAWLVIRCRPDVVVSTGALPGLIAVFCGKLCGARTVWLDTFANYGRLSMCGRLAGKFVSLWLTQWPHLAKEKGPVYRGRII